MLIGKLPDAHTRILDPSSVEIISTLPDDGQAFNEFRFLDKRY